MYRVSYVVLLLIGVAGAWAFVSARTTTIERRARAQRAEVGGFFEEWVAVDNTSIIPKAWVELRSDSNLAEHAARRGFFLGPHARRSWTLRTECTTRGKFILGDILVATGDPFGLFQASARYHSGSTVIVYPRTVEFNPPPPVPGQLPGGAQQRGQVPFVTPTAAGVREYQPSDPFNRIHWPTTARIGRLMVKEFELDPFADIWIALDLNRFVHHGRRQESTEEYAVTLAASLARQFLTQNRALGLLAQGEVLQPDRGIRQLSKVLELFAMVKADRWESLAELISNESLHLSRLSTLVVVTPAVDETWVNVCHQLLQRGAHVLVVLLEPSTFGGPTGSIDVIGSLAAATIPTYLVKRGDPLESVFLNGGSTAVSGRWPLAVSA
jgi:uncharacterized protein (DUF58 family)